MRTRCRLLLAATSLLALGERRTGSTQTTSPPIILTTGLTCTGARAVGEADATALEGACRDAAEQGRF
jgi:hypothetical protein